VRYGRADGFARQWAVASQLALGRATTAQLAAQFSVTKKTLRRDLAIISTVFSLYRDRIGPLIYWTMSSEGAQKVRVLLRKQRGYQGSYPIIVRFV
jgi:predicted DNA-binding transcriptional regulator YafY